MTALTMSDFRVLNDKEFIVGLDTLKDHSVHIVTTASSVTDAWDWQVVGPTYPDVGIWYKFQFGSEHDMLMFFLKVLK